MSLVLFNIFQTKNVHIYIWCYFLYLFETEDYQIGAAGGRGDMYTVDANSDKSIQKNLAILFMNNRHALTLKKIQNCGLHVGGETFCFMIENRLII